MADCSSALSLVVHKLRYGDLFIRLSDHHADIARSDVAEMKIKIPPKH